MNYYNGICLIKIPDTDDRFVISIDTYMDYKTLLENQKRVPARNLVITKELNPWGPQGESYEEIKSYFSPSGSLKYPREHDYIEGYYYSLKKIPPKGPSMRTDVRALFVSDIYQELEKWKDKCLSVSLTEEFFSKADVRYISWETFLKIDKADMGSLYHSKKLVVDDESVKFISIPFYYIELSIKDSKGVFVAGSSKKELTLAWGLSKAKHFNSENEALEYVLKYEKGVSVKKGFEVKKSKDLTSVEYIYYAK